MNHDEFIEMLEVLKNSWREMYYAKEDFNKRAAQQIAAEINGICHDYGIDLQ